MAYVPPGAMGLSKKSMDIMQFAFFKYDLLIVYSQENIII